MRQISPIGRSRSGSSGFTLLELLIAITLGALVSAAVYQSFGTAVDASRRIASASSASQEWRFFVERLRADLNTLSMTGTPLVGTRDSLKLVVLGAAEQDGSQASVEGMQIAYEHTPNEDGGQIRRRLGTKADEIGDVVVYSNVAEVEFRYLADGEWTDRTETLPRAVECKVSGERGEQRIVVAIEVERVES